MKLAFYFVLLFVSVLTCSTDSHAEPMQINGKAVNRTAGTPLKGKVQDTEFAKNFRLQRPQDNKAPQSAPLSTGTSAEQSKPLFTGASTDQSKPLLPMDPHASILTPVLPAAARTDTLLPAEKTNQEVFKNDEVKAKADSQDSNKPVVAQKRVIIRIRRVVALYEAEIAESALKTALFMLKQEPESNVTVFLDLDAVSLADGEFTWHDQLSAGEDGNLRVISIKHLRGLLTKFGAEGGRIVVAERWVKVRGFRHHTNTIVPHSELLDDEAIAKVLLEATNVIDY